MSTSPKPCIICGQPRHNTRLTCASAECEEKLAGISTEELNAICEREAIEAWQKVLEGRPYVHLTPREANGSDPFAP
jgi:hypothetical protein